MGLDAKLRPKEEIPCRTAVLTGLAAVLAPTGFVLLAAGKMGVSPSIYICCAPEQKRT